MVAHGSYHLHQVQFGAAPPVEVAAAMAALDGADHPNAVSSRWRSWFVDHDRQGDRSCGGLPPFSAHAVSYSRNHSITITRAMMTRRRPRQVFPSAAWGHDSLNSPPCTHRRNRVPADALHTQGLGMVGPCPWSRPAARSIHAPNAPVTGEPNACAASPRRFRLRATTMRTNATETLPVRSTAQALETESTST